MMSQKYEINGSSTHSSGSTTPDIEIIGDLPPAQLFEQSDERVPTPFPAGQPSADQPLVDELPPLPLVMPLPVARSPIRHQTVNLQLSNNSASTSSDGAPPPIPLTPTVHIINTYPYALSGSSSAASFQAIGHLIQRLREDRRMNEETRSRSVASGLYEFANMIMPGLPEYEVPVYEEDFKDEEEVRRKRRRETYRFFIIMGVATGLISSAFIGQQIGDFIFRLNMR